jgi:hypothetical protein
VLALVPATDMGCRLRPHHQHRKKTKEFSLQLNKRSKCACRERIEVWSSYKSRHDCHATVICRRNTAPRSDLEAGKTCASGDKLGVMRDWVCQIDGSDTGSSQWPPAGIPVRRLRKQSAFRDARWEATGCPVTKC